MATIIIACCTQWCDILVLAYSVVLEYWSMQNGTSAAWQQFQVGCLSQVSWDSNAWQQKSSLGSSSKSLLPSLAMQWNIQEHGWPPVESSHCDIFEIKMQWKKALFSSSQLLWPDTVNFQQDDIDKTFVKFISTVTLILPYFTLPSGERRFTA